MGGPDPVGLSELAFHAATRQVDLHGKPLMPELGGQRHRLGGQSRIGDSDEQVHSGRCHVFIKSEQNPFDPGRPANRRRGRAAELVDQSVISSTATDFGLCSQPVADEREDGPRVVVEPANQGRIDRVLDRGRSEESFYLFKMRGILFVQVLEQSRSFSHHRPGSFMVRIEGPQRIDLDSLAHVIREFAGTGPQMGFELFEVAGPRFV